MKIAIDARAASHPQRGGFKTYTSNLLKGLAAIDKVNNYSLFFDREYSEAEKFPENFNSRVIPAKIRGFGAVYREQILIPRAFNQESVQLGHFPCNTGPIRANLPYILSLLDVIELEKKKRIEKLPLRKFIWTSLMSIYHELVIPQVARRAGAIITISTYEKAQISRLLRIRDDRIFVTYLGVDKIFQPPLYFNHISGSLLERLGLEKGYILGVGSQARKNFAGLIKSYEILRNHYEFAPELVLVQPHTAFSQEITKLIGTLGLNEFVKVVSDLQTQDLAFIYQHASMFVFPSFREGFGLPPLEAMACGTPVIVATTSSLPEVIGEAGLYVDPSNHHQIAESMERILTNPTLAAELREKGLKQAAKFTWKATAEQTLSVYEKVFQNMV